MALVPGSLAARVASRFMTTRSNVLPAGVLDGASLGQGWNIIRGDTPTQFQQNGKTVRIEGWERHPVVMACSRLIAEIIASVPFEVYKLGADGAETVLPSHPLGKLLETPYINMSGFRFRLLSTLHYLIYGNLFWLFDRGNINLATAGSIPQSTALPTGLRLLHPERIMYCYTDAEDEEPVVWDWRDRNGIRHRSFAQDILHVADMTASDWIFGYPRAAAALLDITSDNMASNYVRTLVGNDATPTLVMLMDQDLGAVTGEELKAASDRWYERERMRGELGRARFLASVKDVKQIGFNLKDLEFPGLRAISREDICAVFGIDPRMVGIASAKGADGGLSGQQYFEARFRLVQQTIIPTMEAICAEINTWLAPEYGDVYVRFSRQGLSKLTEDEKDTWTRGTAALTAGGITREEFRDMIGKDEAMEDADHLVMASTSSVQLVSEADETSATKLDTLKNPPPPPPGLNGPSNPQGAVGGGAAPPKQLPAGKSKADRGAAPPRVDLAHAALVTRGTVLTPELRRAAWSQLDTTASALEPKYVRANALLFDTERKGVKAVFDSYADRSRRPLEQRDALAPDPHVAEAQRRILADYRGKGKYYQAWLKKYQALTSETVGVAGSEMATALGVDFNLHDPQIAQITEQRATQLADYVSKTTAESIKAAVDVGVEQGMGISEIADLIQASVFGDMADSRATTIARTETIGALNQSAYVTAGLSGVVQEKEWLTQGDDRVRESHAEIDGETVGLDESFSNGLAFPGDQDGDPEDVINCRCGLLYHTTPEES